MVIRADRKRKKYLGNRTRGAGNTKNRRGRGCKGGLGNVGRFKHKKCSVDSTPKSRQKPIFVENSINLFRLNDYIATALLEKKLDSNNIVLDFAEDVKLRKYDKVVANGNINYKVVFKNVKSSKSAEEKVKEKGGSFE